MKRSRTSTKLLEDFFDICREKTKSDLKTWCELDDKGHIAITFFYFCGNKTIFIYDFWSDENIKKAKKFVIEAMRGNKTKEEIRTWKMF